MGRGECQQLPHNYFKVLKILWCIRIRWEPNPETFVVSIGFSRWNQSYLTWRMPKALQNIVSCSYWKNAKNNSSNFCFKKKITFHRWTNIPEQNFNPQLENVINNDHITSISSHPLSREPFFIKYPWILEDIVVKTFHFKFLWRDHIIITW